MERKIVVRLPQDLVAALQVRKERTGCTTSVYVRHIVRKVLAGEGYFQPSATVPAAGSVNAK